MNYQSAIFSKYLSDGEIAEIVSDKALIKYMLQFEIALANAQAKLGIIHKNVAIEITTVLGQLKTPPSSLAKGTLQNGVPVLSLLALARPVLSDKGKKYLHYGATSQDAMDTALILIIKDAVDIIEDRIKTLKEHLVKLSRQEGNTPCMAHTRGQQAMPITFAAKIKAWVQPLQRQLERLKEIKQRLYRVQLGGAVGTLYAYKNKGSDLADALANELKLQSADAWHTQRDNICEFTNWLAILTGILGKMGADILVMAQSEINEIIENETGGGKSSAMTHKNNPVLSEALVALAKINATLQSQQLQSLVHTNERDATAWILEWNAIPQMLINTGTSLNHAITIGANMKVNAEQMKKNVELFLKNNPVNKEAR